MKRVNFVVRIQVSKGYYDMLTSSHMTSVEKYLRDVIDSSFRTLYDNMNREFIGSRVDFVSLSERDITYMYRLEHYNPDMDQVLLQSLRFMNEYIIINSVEGIEK